MDKYEEELEIAIKKATIIPREKEYIIPILRCVGIVKSDRGNTYYYHNKYDDCYYSETDFDREMRAVIRKKRFQCRTK